MATILESLKGVNAYPVPLRTLTEISVRRGLSLDSDATQEVLKSAGYNLALGDILLWLSMAPDISQGGQDYSFTDQQRTSMRSRANAIFSEYDSNSGRKPLFGYKGSRL